MSDTHQALLLLLYEGDMQEDSLPFQESLGLTQVGICCTGQDFPVAFCITPPPHSPNSITLSQQLSSLILPMLSVCVYAMERLQ